MKVGKFLTTSIIAATFFSITAEAIPENQNSNELPPAQNVPSTSTEILTPENSGLNPGYTVPVIKGTNPPPPGDALPEVVAVSAIVIEASTGHVIYARNAEQKMFPASTTKIMTLITALEEGDPDDIVTVSKNSFGTEGSTLWLEEGEKIKLGDLMTGLIMVSGNDAAVAIAEHIDGSTTKFAERMTKKAKEIGATHTQFKNPHGLPDEQHYTTAHDLALIAAYGYSLKNFEDIVTLKEKPFPRKQDPNNLLKSENQMLWLYRGGNGVKTGYTDAAGRCLVSAAKRDGIQIVAVVLNSDYMWNDSIFLLDYGFKHVETKKLLNAGEVVETLPVESGRRKSVQVFAKKEIVVPVFKNETEPKIQYDLPDYLSAPVRKGDIVGKAFVMRDGKKIAETDLIAASDSEQNSFFAKLKDFIVNLFKSKVK